ncbi:hypothetical protein [Aeromicrobium sp. CTD01-1L150]|uniref:hypothetical protein n=1 Tax=Aeromicrobium sp. CTD01-1L150 TaxID=3341830 RepID=UPI0035C1B330
MVAASLLSGTASIAADSAETETSDVDEAATTGDATAAAAQQGSPAAYKHKVGINFNTIGIGFSAAAVVADKRLVLPKEIVSSKYTRKYRQY